MEAEFFHITNDKDHLMLDNIPPEMANVCKEFFNDSFYKTVDAINKLIEDNETNKKNFCIELVKSFNEINETVKEDFYSPKRIVDIKIEGKYESSFTVPSIEYWKKCNHIKYKAIELILTDLIKKGYIINKTCISPFKKIGEIHYGGNYLCFSFNK